MALGGDAAVEPEVILRTNLLRRCNSCSCAVQEAVMQQKMYLSEGRTVPLPMKVRGGAGTEVKHVCWQLSW